KFPRTPFSPITTTPTTDIYTLSLHDALPICQLSEGAPPCHLSSADNTLLAANYHKGSIGMFSITNDGAIYEGTFDNRDGHGPHEDRKSTRLNSSHVSISYAVFCLKKKIDSTK